MPVCVATGGWQCSGAKSVGLYLWPAEQAAVRNYLGLVLNFIEGRRYSFWQKESYEL